MRPMRATTAALVVVVLFAACSAPSNTPAPGATSAPPGATSAPPAATAAGNPTTGAVAGELQGL